MSPRTLFVIILKVLGIISLKELLSAIPALISQVVMYAQNFSVSGGLLMVIISLIIVLVFGTISYYLIFKANFLVSRFGLDKGIPEPSLQLNINIPSILRIAIIVTGVLMLLLAIPEFLRSIYQFVQKDNQPFFSNESPDLSSSIVSGAKIILGLLIIGERVRILKFLEKPAESEVGPQE